MRTAAWEAVLAPSEQPPSSLHASPAGETMVNALDPSCRLLQDVRIQAGARERGRAP